VVAVSGFGVSLDVSGAFGDSGLEFSGSRCLDWGLDFGVSRAWGKVSGYRSRSRYNAGGAEWRKVLIHFGFARGGDSGKDFDFNKFLILYNQLYVWVYSYRCVIVVGGVTPSTSMSIWWVSRFHQSR
jgi:hypothetical protein